MVFLLVQELHSWTFLETWLRSATPEPAERGATLTVAVTSHTAYAYNGMKSA
jgi:hypothetical protein